MIVHTHTDSYIRVPLSLYSFTLPLYPVSLRNQPSSSHPRSFTAWVYVTRGAMLHRATWKFSSLRVHTRIEESRGCGSSSLRLCVVLYDSIVALMAPLSECVGSGAHGKCARARQRTLSTYTIHRTRPANYISRDRADFTNTRSTARVEYVRAPHAATRPSRYYTWRSTRRVALRTNPRPIPRFAHFLFVVSVTFV